MILNSERSEIMYWFYNDVCFVFFLPVSNILDSKHDLIFEISIFSDRQVSLVGTFRRLKLKIPISFRKRREKLPANHEKPLKMVF